MMELQPTFEAYNTSSAIIAMVSQRGGEFVVTSLANTVITRRYLSGAMLAGFSTDLIVMIQGKEAVTYTPELNFISRLYLAPNDAVRGVVGPNVLVYRAADKRLTVYDKKFNIVSRFVANGV